LEWIIGIILFFLGASIGSFIGVVVDRVPKGQSIIKPRSHCPVCGHELNAIDLIPVVSYIMLRGRCRYCGAKIPIQYWLLEVATGLWVAVLGLLALNTMNLRWVEIMIFGLFAIPIMWIDWKTFYMYDSMLLPLIGVELVFSFVVHPPSLWERLIAAAILFALFGILYIVFKGKMGFGDVELVTAIGLLLGSQSLLWPLFAGIYGLFSYLIPASRENNDEIPNNAVPFGPAMLLAALTLALFGNQIFAWYLSLF